MSKPFSYEYHHHHSTRFSEIRLRTTSNQSPFPYPCNLSSPSSQLQPPRLPPLILIGSTDRVGSKDVFKLYRLQTDQKKILTKELFLFDDDIVEENIGLL